MDKMLITKLVLEQGNRVALYERGHKFRDLVLFDLSDLAEVGIDYASLQVGQEVPCRFWAYYQESNKLNQAGNPYKDVKALEPFDAPTAPADLDASEILAELRAIRALLEQQNALIARTLGLELPGVAPHVEAPAPPAAAEPEPVEPEPAPLNGSMRMLVM